MISCARQIVVFKIRLKGKVAVVTGVARPHAMGYAIAKVLATEGAVLAITDVSEQVHERAKEMQLSGYELAAYRVDLTNSKETNEMVKKVLERFGKVDILVNVAGGVPWGSKPRLFVDMTEEEWDKVIGINLKTTFNCIKAVLPSMIKQKSGKIVNISSVTGPVVANPGLTHYAAAKAGVTGLTKSLATEVGKYGINVNAILPGSVDTRFYEMSAGAHDMRGQMHELEVKIPLKRIGEPEEVGDLVLFLASDESRYITGQMIVIDGGAQLEHRTSLVSP